MGKYSFKIIVGIYFYIAVLLIAYLHLPKEFLFHDYSIVVVPLGVLGVWRYSWWFTHFIRAKIYEKKVYSKLSKDAEQLWGSGWRPNHLYIMMTAYDERSSTICKAIKALFDEIRCIDTPATLFIGTALKEDEDVIGQYIQTHPHPLNIAIKFVRQVVPGKRFAIGSALRAISRYKISENDPVIFLDGDSIIVRGSLQKCLPLFKLNHKLEAMTTNEKAIVIGPRWIQSLLDLRFAQRHLIMQSHALSKKVLTLTGRMSIFRGRHITKLEFIKMVEVDHLNNWLWGDFRFISGDDKSTWYYLLRERAEMLYVPDAEVITIEEIKGSGITRMKANLLRWSGNMLRNGARAIKLGPRRVGFFIWWCVVDQRIAMWTMLVSPVAMLTGGLFISFWFVYLYILWIAFSRLLLSLVLFAYMEKITLWAPLMLYLNQIANASIKVNLLFRLPKQPWAHRFDQINQFKKFDKAFLRLSMARYLTCLFVFLLFMFTVLYTQILPWGSFLNYYNIVAIFK